MKSRCFASTCSVCNLSVRGKMIFLSLSLSLSTVGNIKGGGEAHECLNSQSCDSMIVPTF